MLVNSLETSPLRRPVALLGLARLRLVLLSCLLLPSTVIEAGTIVRVSTTIGDYSIELLDDITPITVENFLNYTNRGDYNGTYIHRAVDGFVVQGGAFRFQPFVGPVPVATDPAITNEFNISNTRGTVAMAKLDGDPNSATNQWFVNLADNSLQLDPLNGGFTVFGNVLGDGMITVDAIDALPFVALGGLAPNAPYVTATYSTPANFVFINVEVTDRFSAATNVFEDVTGLLIMSVNVDNGSQLFALNMSLMPTTNGEVTLKLNADSIISRTALAANAATFSTADNLLRIPELEVNLGGEVSVATDVVFRLSDARNLLFTLVSFEL